jgi:hypothetical protein
MRVIEAKTLSELKAKINELIEKEGVVVESQRGTTKEVTHVLITIPYDALLNFWEWGPLDFNFARMRYQAIFCKVHNQINSAIKMLNEYPNTRRAYILEPDYHPYGPPCVIVISFLVREGFLDASVFIRSSDVDGVLPYDLFAFRELINEVRDEVQAVVRPGKICIFIQSMHRYLEKKKEGWT